ncbi:MAG: hypothetical protein JSR47_24915 [Proteobacteria bacterium]|nr:hypothetical protein [Pseudomonadota bacterium]
MSASLVRRPDWPQRLAALFEERRHTPYAFGTNDCGVMMRESVRAMTGVDLFPGVEAPGSALAVAKFLKRNGWADVEDMMAAVLGPALPRTAFARRGDVVSFASPDGEFHLAVVAGATAGTPGPAGLEWVPMMAWRKAWKVG